MKKAVFLFLMLLACAKTNAQKMVSDYFEEGVKFSEDSNYSAALNSFLYIVHNHPKNELYPRALYNTGILYQELSNNDSACAIFRTILHAGFNERESLGGDIMSDPYTNYAHWASTSLSNIYYSRNMYDSALYYLAVSDTVWPYIHFCGNEYAENDVRMALRYADIYQKLNNNKEAISKLLKACMTTLANNMQVIEQAKRLLKNEGYTKLRAQLDKSLKNMKYETIERSKYTYRRYSIVFLKTRMFVNHSDKKGRKADNEAIKQFKQSNFYKMICEL